MRSVERAGDGKHYTDIISTLQILQAKGTAEGEVQPVRGVYKWPAFRSDCWVEEFAAVARLRGRERTCNRFGNGDYDGH